MTDWTAETDEEADARRRMGAIDGRYQVCHPTEGLLECASTLAEAIDIGDRYTARKLPDGQPYCSTPFEVEVYDRMARRGQPRLWRRCSKKMTHCVETGDKYSLDAFWKCIEKRGMKRMSDDFTRLLWR